MNKANEEYQMVRNRLTSTLLNLREEEYKNIIENGDDKKLWSKINWSGRHNSNSQHIPIQMISNYFEQLYQPLDTNEKREMEKLQSSVYIPITDDPITGNEIHDAYSDMKKGGYDFSLPVLKILVAGFLPILLLILNLVSYVSYPLKFGISLLCAIPKKGNLKLLTNYRGIHMQHLLSLLYDRIIANRLNLWAKVHPEKRTFKKANQLSIKYFF